MRLPVGEDSELHGITLCQQVFLAGGRPLNIQLDVHVGSYLSHVGWGLLQAANLQNMQILWPYEEHLICWLVS